MKSVSPRRLTARPLVIFRGRGIGRLCHVEAVDYTLARRVAQVLRAAQISRLLVAQIRSGEDAPVEESADAAGMFPRREIWIRETVRSCVPPQDFLQVSSYSRRSRLRSYILQAQFSHQQRERELV